VSPIPDKKAPSRGRTGAALWQIVALRGRLCLHATVDETAGKLQGKSVEENAAWNEKTERGLPIFSGRKNVCTS
jgi:hypothetical protein